MYRWILGRVTARGFRDHQVLPIEVPGPERIDVEPVAPELARLFTPLNFPRTEHAKSRAKAIRFRAKLRPIVSRIPTARSGPIATDHAGLLDQIYPARYRKIWPHPPRTPPELEADDVLAALAVSGPFAMYLQSGSTLDDLAGLTTVVAPGDLVIDMRFFDAYDPKPDLVAPGGLAVFAVDADQLRTRGIVYAGRMHEAGEVSFERAKRAFLCALNTHLTTIVHNVTIHLAYVTPMAVASTNELDPDHPIRRLLHPSLHTTLIGNHELAQFQVVGERSFATTLFSHEYPTLVSMINAHLDDFRISSLDPDVAFEHRGLGGATIALPWWDDAMALWRINLAYTERYVAHYYPDDAAVADDRQLDRWRKALDRLLPSGLDDEATYPCAGRPLDRRSLVRICATFLHTSSATHDVVNNAVWDYSTLNDAIPTVVPESLEPQDVRLSFDLLNTIIGTWKPYNMLLDGFSILALDDQGRQIMDDYVGALEARQSSMTVNAATHQAGRIYPGALNVSVSN
ncbi:MAG: lipoxygenase family protein [Ilumatobacter sp.]